MQPRPFTIRLEIPFNERGATLDELGISAQELWDYYLAEAHDFEVLAAAVLVTVDGTPWNSKEHSESFHHIESWLDATADLLDGETQRGFGAWEESAMEMRREGNAVVLQERTHHEHMHLMPICLDLCEFARALKKASASGKEFIGGLKNCASKQCGDDWRQLSIQWGEYVGEKEIRLMSQEEFERRKPLGQQGEAELRKAMFLGYRPTGRPRDRHGQRIADILYYLRHERFTSSWVRLASCLQSAT
jgi:hypothetical protein